jgi:hypothetical protein
MLTRLTTLTRIEVAVVIAIVLFLATLLFWPARWVSDGEVDVPVRVFVFDAQDARPIAGARVGVIHFWPVHSSETLAEYRQEFPVRIDDIPAASRGVTDSEGTVTIMHRFRKSASDRTPKGLAHLWLEWVFVETPGYTGVAMPVRYESVPLPSLRDEGTVPMTIGLVRPSDAKPL